MEVKYQNIPYNLKKVINFRTVGMVMPNKLMFGLDASKLIGDESSKLAKGNVLIISDKVLFNIGTVQKIKKSLQDSGFSVDIFLDVEPEPQVETADNIYKKCLENNFSLIIGLGGGSVMDVTKIVSASITNNHAPSEFITGDIIPNKNCLPMILIPTTAGTGSEVSPYTVLCIGEDKYFLNNDIFYPNIAIVDPLLTISSPQSVTASCGMDVISHAIEGMMHVDANPLTDTLGMAALEMAYKYIRKAVTNGHDVEARYYMSMAATLSMMAMATSGGLYAHSASFVITKYQPTAHGVGCGIALPYLMKYNLPLITSKLSRMAQVMGETNQLKSERQSAEIAISSIVQLNNDIGLPMSLKEHFTLNNIEVKELAEIMIKKYPRPGNPRVMTLKDSELFWNNMWQGVI